MRVIGVMKGRVWDGGGVMAEEGVRAWSAF